MINNKKKVIAVMPAYNAQRTIKQTFLDIPQGAVDEVILGDDASSDDTVAVAHSLGMHVLQHKANKGYGANQKTCYEEALKRGAEIVFVHFHNQTLQKRYVENKVVKTAKILSKFSKKKTKLYLSKLNLLKISLKNGKKMG